LNAHIGRAQRGRCRLDPHARRLAYQHGDVAGAHEELLFDLLAVDDLDANGLVLNPKPGARCLDHNLGFGLLGMISLGLSISWAGHHCRDDQRAAPGVHHAATKYRSHIAPVPA